MYSTFCDLFANEQYRGTLVIASAVDAEQALMAMDLWTDFKIVTIVRDFLVAEYGNCEVHAYVKKVL